VGVPNRNHLLGSTQVFYPFIWPKVLIASISILILILTRLRTTFAAETPLVTDHSTLDWLRASTSRHPHPLSPTHRRSAMAFAAYTPKARVQKPAPPFSGTAVVDGTFEGRPTTILPQYHSPSPSSSRPASRHPTHTAPHHH
jgi:hypothetical protein